MAMRTISVIIPAYNRSHLICQAIDSVLLQTRPVDEIIVIDDGSIDKTRETLRSYGNRILYIYQNNAGPGSARNRGIKAASGEYIAFLDSDDIWIRNKMEMQMEFFSRHPHLDLVFGDHSNFSDNEHNNQPEIKNRRIHDYLAGHASNLTDILECLIVENIISTPTVVFKRSCMNKVGFFNESLKIAEDFDYWLRAARCCRFGFVNAVLAKRRRHEGNLINDWVQRTRAVGEVLAGLETSDFVERQSVRNILSTSLFKIHYDLGSYFFKLRDFSAACMHFNKCMERRRMNGKLLIKFLLGKLVLKVERMGFLRKPFSIQ